MTHFHMGVKGPKFVLTLVFLDFRISLFFGLLFHCVFMLRLPIVHQWILLSCGRCYRNSFNVDFNIIAAYVLLLETPREV